MIKALATISFALFLLLAVGATDASAQWENLGSKEVTDRAEQDTFHLAGDGQFRKLRFSVSRRPVRFYKMVVTYGNGEKDEIELRALIRAGGQSRIIDLSGKDRFIRKVDFWYEAASIGRGRRSTVTLFGMK